MGQCEGHAWSPFSPSSHATCLRAYVRTLLPSPPRLGSILRLLLGFAPPLSCVLAVSRRLSILLFGSHLLGAAPTMVPRWRITTERIIAKRYVRIWLVAIFASPPILLRRTLTCCGVQSCEIRQRDCDSSLPMLSQAISKSARGPSPSPQSLSTLSQAAKTSSAICAEMMSPSQKRGKRKPEHSHTYVRT